MLIVNFEVRTAFASAIPARNPCLLPQAKRLNEVKCGGKPNGLTLCGLNQFNISKMDLGLLLLLAGLVRLEPDLSGFALGWICPACLMLLGKALKGAQTCLGAF